MLELSRHSERKFVFKESGSVANHYTSQISCIRFSVASSTESLAGWQTDSVGLARNRSKGFCGNKACSTTEAELETPRSALFLRLIYKDSY